MSGLTKEELKSALISHGVTPPPASARKDEFVALYEEYVAPVDQESGDFSDDEVTISPRKKVSQSSAKSSASKSPKKGRNSKGGDTITEEGSLIVGDINVEEIDDDQLFNLLKENGVNVGPIVASTRPFYKKKLALILKGDSGDQNGVENGTNGGEFSDTEPETETEDDQPSGIVSPQVPEPRVSTRGGAKGSTSSQKSNKSLAAASPAADMKTGLRKRLNITDEVDMSLRNTPTQRRSIHTYKITESSRQKLVISADGAETRDTSHSVERTESRSEDGKPSFFSIKKILIAFVVVAVVLAILPYLSKQKDGMSVDSIMNSFQKSISGNPTAAPAVEAPAAAAPPAAAPPRDQPDQPAVADV